MMSDRRWTTRLVAGALLGGLSLGACGGLVGSVVGGESHFLTYCESECEGGFDCISGVCTE